jgi:hypothetical protein
MTSHGTTSLSDSVFTALMELAADVLLVPLFSCQFLYTGVMGLAV